MTAGSPFSVTVTARELERQRRHRLHRHRPFHQQRLQAGLPANYTFVAGDDGTHTFSVTLKTAGTQYVTATDTVNSSITGTESGIVVQAAAPSRWPSPASPPPSPRAPRVTSRSPPTIAYGNVATGYTGTVALHQQRSPGRPAGQLHVRSRAITGRTRSRPRSRRRAPQSITATDTVTSSITGTESGNRRPARGAPSR